MSDWKRDGKRERKKEREVKINKRAKTSEQMEESWAHNEVNVANEKKNFTDFMSKIFCCCCCFPAINVSVFTCLLCDMSSQATAHDAHFADVTTSSFCS